MLGIEKNLGKALVGIGSAAVREVVILANRLSVDPDHLPYVFWALATQSGIPAMGAQEQKAFSLLVSILVRTGTMPKYEKSFSIEDDTATNSAIDVIARHMGQWARRTMHPLLIHAYQNAINSQVAAVPAATNGLVSSGDAFDFLRKSFRQILSIRSRMFRDGELLRRVVRALPI